MKKLKNIFLQIKKSDENDKFDAKQLLVLIPKGKKKNAKRLLSEFEERPNELTWSSDGIIFIDQIAVPNSNIYTIFPMLFKKRVEPNIIGMKDFLKKLDEMKLTSFLQKDSNTQVTPQEDSLNSGSGVSIKANPSDRWWFIGP